MIRGRKLCQAPPHVFGSAPTEREKWFVSLGAVCLFNFFFRLFVIWSVPRLGANRKGKPSLGKPLCLVSFVFQTGCQRLEGSLHLGRLTHSNGADYDDMLGCSLLRLPRHPRALAEDRIRS